MYIAIHVDDGIIFGEGKSQTEKVPNGLQKSLEISKRGNPTMYLGMEIKISTEGIWISQENYAKKVLEKFNMQDCKDRPTPLVTKPSTESGEENESRFPCREAVGSLLHLSTKTRPDLVYAVNVESRTLENPDKTAIQNVKRTRKYLQGAQDLKVKYASTKGETIKLEAFSGADYAGDTKDRKSTTGYVIFMAGGPITWCSRKREIVALSTTEAEYIAAAECCKELKYLKTIIQELTNIR
jgi:hypothetical protein